MKKWFGILMTVACIVAFSMPASAAEAISDNWTVNGQVGLFTGYTMEDSSYPGYESSSALKWDAWDTMYIDFKYQSDKVKARIEIKDEYKASIDMHKTELAHAYGQVDLGGWSMLVGRTDPLTFNPTGTPRGKYANFGLGSSIGGTGDKLQLRAIIPFKNRSRLEIMLADPNTNFQTNIGGTPEVKMPAIEAKYSAFTGFPWAIYGGYQSVDDAVDGGDTVTSYLIGAVARPKTGPVAWNIGLLYDTNMYISKGYPAMYTPNFAGVVPARPWPAWNYSADENTTNLGATLTGEWTFSKTLGLGFGIGYNDFNAGDGYQDTNMSYYINLPWYVHPQFRILPYYAIRNMDKVTLGGTDYDQVNYSEIGIFWRVTF